MNLSFKVILQKEWTLLDDKIIYGDKEILLSEIQEIKVVTKAVKGINGLVQIRANGKYYNLAYPSKLREEGDQAIMYMQEHYGSQEGKANRKSMNEILQEINSLPYKDNWKAVKEVSELPKILSVDEHIKAMAVGFIDGNSWLLVCTERRFLMLDSNALAQVKNVVIPLDRINSITHSKGVILGKMTITDGAVTRVIDKVSNNTVEFFANTLNKQVEEIRNRGTALVTNITNNVSSADEILKYKQLLDLGVINQDEFEMKKKELLGL